MNWFKKSLRLKTKGVANEIEMESGEKVECTNCGAKILPYTAKKYRGLCAPCARGESIARERRLRKEKKSTKTHQEMPFRMIIEDTFFTSEGAVVAGRVETGVLHIGDEVEIVGRHGCCKTVIKRIERFRKKIDEATPGLDCGIFVEGITKDYLYEHVHPGNWLCAAGTSAPIAKELREVKGIQPSKYGQINEVKQNPCYISGAIMAHIGMRRSALYVAEGIWEDSDTAFRNGFKKRLVHCYISS